MKLLFCEDCWDIFKLDTDEERACKCGKVTGQYIDNNHAITNGKGYSIAIGNGALLNAITKMLSIRIIGKKSNIKLSRGHFRDACQIEYAWVRPNEGAGNPHTKVSKE